MELVTGTAKSRLDEINSVAVQNCDWVQAAIAYVTDEKTLLRTVRILVLSPGERAAPVPSHTRACCTDDIGH